MVWTSGIAMVERDVVCERAAAGGGSGQARVTQMNSVQRVHNACRLYHGSKWPLIKRAHLLRLCCSRRALASLACPTSLDLAFSKTKIGWFPLSNPHKFSMPHTVCRRGSLGFAARRRRDAVVPVQATHHGGHMAGLGLPPSSHAPSPTPRLPRHQAAPSVPNLPIFSGLEA